MNIARKIILLIILLPAFMPLAHASYIPFNTNAAGNIGIGSTAPGQRLDVQGTVRATGFVGNGSGLTGLSSGLWATQNTTDQSLVGGNVGIGTTITNAGAALSVMNGNVGIGTWVPGALLNVNPNGQGGIIIGNANQYSGGYTNLSLNVSANSGGYSSIQSIQSAGSTYGVLSLNPNGGNVGIGTSQPFALFSIGTNNGTGVLGSPGGFQVDSKGSLTMYGDDGTVYFLGNVHTHEIGTDYSTFDDGDGNVNFAGVLNVNSSNNNISPEFAVNDFNDSIALQVNDDDSGRGDYVRTLNNVIDDGNGNVGIGTVHPNNSLIVAIGNVGIGTAFPGQKLDVQGTVRATNFVGNGSGLTGLSSGLWATQNTTDQSLAGGNVGIGTTITNAGAALSVMNGNVGIGTWAPSGSLEIWSSGINNQTELNIINNNLGLKTPIAQFGGSSDGWYSAIGYNTSATSTNALTIGFAGNNYTNLVQMQSGHASSVVLNIEGASSQTGNLTNWENSAGSVLSLVDANGNLGIGTLNPFGGKLIVTGGNVGIGSLTPGTTLDVNGTIRSISGGFIFPDGTIQTSAASGGGWSTGTGTVYTTTPSNNVGIGASTPQGGLVVTNGNVGIGTWVPAAALDIAGNLQFSKAARTITTGNDGTNGYALTIQPSNGIGSSTGNGGAITIQAGQAATNGGSSGAGGNITITAGGMNGGGGGGTSGTVSITSGAAAGGQTSGALNISTGTGGIGDGAITISTPNTSTFGGNINITAGSGAASSGSIILTTTNSGSIPGTTQITGGNVGISTTNPLGKLIVWGGNVGIGSNVPGQALDVQGTVRASYFVGNGSLLSGLSSSQWVTQNSTDVSLAGGNVGIGTTITNAGAALTVMNGNVGIGTWVPSSTLAVEGQISAIASGATANLTALTNGTNYPRGAFQIGNSTSDVNVGVYVSPSYSSNGLQIPALISVATDKTPSDSNEKEALLYQTTTYALIGALQEGGGAGTNGTPLEFSTQNDVITGSTPALYISNASTQNVGISTISPVYKLDVNGDIGNSTGGNLYLQDKGGSVYTKNNTLDDGSGDVSIPGTISAMGGDVLINSQFGNTVFSFTPQSADQAAEVMLNSDSTSWSLSSNGTSNTSGSGVFTLNDTNDSYYTPLEIINSQYYSLSTNGGDGDIVILGGYNDGNSDAIDQTSTLQVLGDANISGGLTVGGKLNENGGVDPPFVLLDVQTQAQIIDRMDYEVPVEKRSGLTLYWDGKNLNGLTVDADGNGTVYQIQMTRTGTFKMPNNYNTRSKNIYYWDAQTQSIKSMIIGVHDHSRDLPKGERVDHATGKIISMPKNQPKQLPQHASINQPTK